MVVVFGDPVLFAVIPPRGPVGGAVGGCPPPLSSDPPPMSLMGQRKTMREADVLALDGKIRFRLDAGFSLVHNAGAFLITDDAQRIRPGFTVVRLHDLPVVFVNLWGWTLTIDDDRLRYALLRALSRLRDGFPLAV